MTDWEVRQFGECHHMHNNSPSTVATAGRQSSVCALMYTILNRHTIRTVTTSIILLVCLKSPTYLDVVFNTVLQMFISPPPSM